MTEFPTGDANTTIATTQINSTDFISVATHAVGGNRTLVWYLTSSIQILDVEMVHMVNGAGTSGSVSLFLRTGLTGSSNFGVWHMYNNYDAGIKNWSSRKVFTDMYVDSGNAVVFNADATSQAAVINIRYRFVNKAMVDPGTKQIVYVQETEKKSCGIMDFLGGNCNV